MAKKNQESAKTKATKKQKAAEDKTFGLKNKKRSAKVQSYVNQVESQSNASAAMQKKKEADYARKQAEKKAEEQAKAEARALLGSSLQQQKVPFGVDPKTVLCAYFKQGLCSKGARCKFAHDLTVERRSEKKNLYTDERKEEDTMENWDEAKLMEVVLSKHGNPKTTTDKICKYFIEAVENQKYGWRWICPNGGDTCMYRHALPPGFKIKTKEEQRLERAAAANENRITLEDFIETERKKLPKELTPVTLETFTKWKQDRAERLRKEQEDAAKKAPKTTMSGRQLMASGKFIEDEDEEDDWDFTELRKETQALDDAEDDAEGDIEGAEGAAKDAEDAGSPSVEAPVATA